MNNVFFDDIRRSVFRGALSQVQVDGINAILAGWRAHGDGDRRKLAYIFATSYHETAHTMRPIAEYGKGRGRKYGRPDAVTGKTYYGRGHVQLTWKNNYQKMGDRLGVDLVNQPERSLDADISVKILIVGMMDGMFTGKALSDYIKPGKTDYKGARRIVNGTDRAPLIAGYAEAFEDALNAAAQAVPAPDHVPDVVPPVSGKPLSKSTTVLSAIGGAVTTGVTALADKSPWLAGFAILVAVCFAAWIIRERRRHARESGI